MLDFVEKYKAFGHSQNGEEGIIKEILKRIKLKKKVVCEFGAADGFYLSNTAGINAYKKILYDVNPKAESVLRAEVTADNVNELVPKVDVLSIDIDGNDFNVWKAYKHKPAIVIIEINSSYETNYYVVHGENGNEGTSYRSMTELGIEKGYFLLCHTGNLIFVLNKYRNLFPEVEGDGLTNSEKYFNTAWLHS